MTPTKNPGADKDDRVLLRISSKLKKKVAKAAKADGRSMSGYIRQVLEEKLKSDRTRRESP